MATEFGKILEMMNPGPGSDNESSEAEEWDWLSCSPEDGTFEYAQALQLLGIDLAKAVPSKIRREAICSLTEIPSSDVIVGRFVKAPTKERLLKLDFIWFTFFISCGLPCEVS